MFLLFNMLSMFVIAFLPRSKHLLILWLQSPSAVILEPKKRKSVTVSTFSPSICHEVTEPDAMIFVFWMLSFKPAFSLSSFTHKIHILCIGNKCPCTRTCNIKSILLLWVIYKFQIRWEWTCSFLSTCTWIRGLCQPHDLSGLWVLPKQACQFFVKYLYVILSMKINDVMQGQNEDGLIANIKYMLFG